VELWSPFESAERRHATTMSQVEDSDGWTDASSLPSASVTDLASSDGVVWPARPKCRADGLVLRVVNRPRERLDAQRPPFSATAISPDCSLMALAGKHGHVDAFWLHSNRHAQVGHSGPQPTSAAFAPFDGTRHELFVGCADGCVRVYGVGGPGDHAAVQAPVATLRGHSSAIDRIVPSPDGKHFLSVSVDRAMIWETESFTRRHSLRAQAAIVDATMVSSPHSNFLVAAFRDDTVVAWRGDSLTCLGKISVPESETGTGSVLSCVDCLALESGRKWMLLLAAGTRTGSVLVWTMSEKETVLRSIVDLPASATSVRKVTLLPPAPIGETTPDVHPGSLWGARMVVLDDSGSIFVLAKDGTAWRALAEVASSGTPVVDMAVQCSGPTDPRAEMDTYVSWETVASEEEEAPPEQGASDEGSRLHAVGGGLPMDAEGLEVIDMEAGAEGAPHDSSFSLSGSADPLRVHAHIRVTEQQSSSSSSSLPAAAAAASGTGTSSSSSGASGTKGSSLSSSSGIAEEPGWAAVPSKLEMLVCLRSDGSAQVFELSAALRWRRQVQLRAARMAKGEVARVGAVMRQGGALNTGRMGRLRAAKRAEASVQEAQDWGKMLPRARQTTDPPRSVMIDRAFSAAHQAARQFMADSHPARAAGNGVPDPSGPVGGRPTPSAVRAYAGWGAPEGHIPETADPSRVFGPSFFAQGRPEHPALRAAVSKDSHDGAFGSHGERVWPPANPKSVNPHVASRRPAKDSSGLSKASHKRIAQRRAAAASAFGGADASSADVAAFGKRVPGIIQLARLTRGGPAVTDEALQELLNTEKSFPEEHRFVAWRFLLRVPGNAQAHEVLVRAGPHPSCADLGERFPIKSHRLLRHLHAALSVVSHWSPILGECPWLPIFMFPFVKELSHQPAIVRHELILAVLWNYAHDFLDSFPMPPLPILTGAERALRALDPELSDHLVQLRVTADRWAWPLLRSALSEVFPRTEWLAVWDHLIAHASDPELFVGCAVAYVRYHRAALLAIQPDRLFGAPGMEAVEEASSQLLHSTLPQGAGASGATAQACQLMRRHGRTDVSAFLKLAARASRELHKQGGSWWREEESKSPVEAGTGPAHVLESGDSYPVFSRLPAYTVDFHLRERERIARAFEAEERRREAAEAADRMTMAAATQHREAAEAAALAVSLEERRAREAEVERALTEAEEDLLEREEWNRRHVSLTAMEEAEAAALEAARAQRLLAAARKHEARADDERRTRRRAATMARAEEHRTLEEQAKARSRLIALRREAETREAAEEEALAASTRMASAQERMLLAEWRAEDEARAVQRTAKQGALEVASAVAAESERARAAIQDAASAAVMREVSLAEAAAHRRARLAAEDEADRTAESMALRAAKSRSHRDVEAHRLMEQVESRVRQTREEAIARSAAHQALQQAADTLLDDEDESWGDDLAAVEHQEHRDAEWNSMAARLLRLQQAKKKKQKEKEASSLVDQVEEDIALEEEEEESVTPSSPTSSPRSSERGEDQRWRVETGMRGVGNPMSGYASQRAREASMGNPMSGYASQRVREATMGTSSSSSSQGVASPSWYARMPADRSFSSSSSSFGNFAASSFPHIAPSHQPLDLAAPRIVPAPPSSSGSSSLSRGVRGGVLAMDRSSSSDDFVVVPSSTRVPMEQDSVESPGKREEELHDSME
jgi:hypothetical protein